MRNVSLSAQRQLDLRWRAVWLPGQVLTQNDLGASQAICAADSILATAYVMHGTTIAINAVSFEAECIFRPD